MTIRDALPYPDGIVIKTPNNTYAFSYLRADTIRGGVKKDIESTVAYTGDSLRTNFIAEGDIEEVPDDVIERVLGFEDVTLLTNVGGGWDKWSGRPEWSDTYVDISDADEVTLEDVQ